MFGGHENTQSLTPGQQESLQRGKGQKGKKNGTGSSEENKEHVPRVAWLSTRAAARQTGGKINEDMTEMSLRKCCVTWLAGVTYLQS